MQNAISISNVLIQPLVSPDNPATSYGIKIGDGVADKWSVMIDKCVFKGGANLLQHSIYSDMSRGISITNCRFESDMSIAEDILMLYARFASITANMFSSNGTIEVDNGLGGSDAGTITGNYVFGGSVTLTTGAPSDWLVQNNI
jgi:hypothetical protein